LIPSSNSYFRHIKINLFFLLFYFFKNYLIIYFNKAYWGLGIGDWGLGIGDWGLGANPNTQSPNAKPQPPLKPKK